MTYYPFFQAYIDNVDGKEIQLSHVTVVSLDGSMRQDGGCGGLGEGHPGGDLELTVQY